MMDRTEAAGLCLCRMCPTFIACGEEVAYCLSPTGKSGCIKDEKCCLCPGCTVLEIEGLQHVYYCIRGSESDQLAGR